LARMGKKGRKGGEGKGKSIPVEKRLPLNAEGVDAPGKTHRLATIRNR